MNHVVVWEQGNLLDWQSEARNAVEPEGLQPLEGFVGLETSGQ